MDKTDLIKHELMKRFLNEFEDLLADLGWDSIVFQSEEDGSFGGFMVGETDLLLTMSDGCDIFDEDGNELTSDFGPVLRLVDNDEEDTDV